MSLPPVEIPLGAMRFNSDSSKLEYFNGDVWMQVHTFTPDLDGGGRAVFAGMTPNASGHTDAIDYITIPTAGNAADFGNLSVSRLGCGAFGSRTRGVFHSGGNSPGLNTIDYVTIAQLGNAVDFGDATTDYRYAKGLSNQTRGMNAGGYNVKDTIDYVTIASTGNAIDFGNLTSTVGGGPGGGASPTRGVFSGGYSPNSPTCLNTLQYVTIATTGNAQDFGDSLFAGYYKTGTSNCIRAVWTGTYASPATLNTIEYAQIQTLGNTVDFGDSPDGRGNRSGATSDSHGGLS